MGRWFRSKWANLTHEQQDKIKKRENSERRKLEQQVINAVRAVYKSAGYQNANIQRSCIQKRANARARWDQAPSLYRILNHSKRNEGVESELDRQCQAAVMNAKTLTEVFDAKVKGYPCFDTSAYYGYYVGNTETFVENHYDVHEYQDELFRMWVADDTKKVKNISDAERFERFKKYIANSMKPMPLSKFSTHSSRVNALTRNGYISRTGNFAKPYGATWGDERRSLFTNQYRRNTIGNEEREKLPQSVRNNLNNYRLNTRMGNRKVPDNQSFCSSGAFEISQARRNVDPSHKNVHHAYKKYQKFMHAQKQRNEKR